MKAKTYTSAVLLWLVMFAGCTGGSVDSVDQSNVEATANAIAAPDQILSNGKILTVDADFNIVEAIALEGDRILATGTNEEITALAAPSTETIDLEGRTVIPGLIDNHVHFIRTVQRWHQQARIDGVDSREAALAILAAHARRLQPGQWFMVQGGWSEDQFADQKGGFTLEELDRAAPNNPMYLQRSYGGAYANTLALNAVGLPTENGAWQRGRPAFGRMFRELAPPSDQQIEQNLYQFSATLNAVGLTTVYDVGRPAEGDVSLIARASSQRQLPLRVFHTLKYRAETPSEADEAVEQIQAHEPFSVDDRIGLLGLGEHVYGPMHDSSNTVEPYSDEIWDEFMKLATVAARDGWNIHEHTMADRTIADFLDRLETLNETLPITDLRWTLAHVLTISDESIQRAKELGLTAAVHGQALHQARPIVPRGNATEAPIPPIQALEGSGVVWGLGTDTGVVSHYQPFVTLMWAAAGLGIDGTQIQPDPVGREAALVAHTRSNSYLLFKEDDLGTLEAGKLADLVVLDRDYLTVPAHEIKDIKPLITMVGGEIVYGEL
ncbi:MAG: amidohydrolase [Gammaproteobacteria bacterium]